MKALLMALVIMLVASPRVLADDMHAYLRDTQEMVRQGKHEEALKRFIWFHDHALEHAPSMYGVRLSFALMYWKQLADVYPPAMAALKQIRDNKTVAIQEGRGNASLFHDVTALNSTLGDDDKTVELFQRMDEKQKELASECWDIAKDAVIAAKRYDLARKYIGNPVREFTRVKALYDQNTTLYGDPQIGGAHFKAYNENRLVEESLKLIEVALALGDHDAAKEVQTQALAVLDDYRLRGAVPSARTAASQPGATTVPSAAGPSAPIGGR